MNNKTNSIGFSKRSVLTLLFAVLWLFIPLTQVRASSVGAGGSFAGYTYSVQPGDNLIDTGTDFNFVNNFPNSITVEFIYEAPLGVTINVPSTLIQIPAGGTYRIPISLTTTASTPVGIFPLRIAGIVIPETVNGVEVSGSAGLNASIRVQGIAPTTPPVFSLVERTQTSVTVSITNPDPEAVSILYSLQISPPITATIDLEPNESVEINFSSLDPNTIYTIFATATASPREESSIVSFQVTTLAEVVPPPSDPDPDPETPPPPAPPPTVAPVVPPSGGGPSTFNELVIELSSKNIEINVTDPYTPPTMNAYVSVRNNVREISRIDVTNRVIITGSVNTNVLGRYQIRYTLRYNNLTLEEIVVVNVRDLIAPRILSASEITIMVDDPYVYDLIATDNYDRPEDLIITGLPANIDTTQVGVQRFNVVVIDQSGNRTPFLFTVNIRERVITPIVVEVNELEIQIETIEGQFNPDKYQVEIAVAANQPLPNSPSWVVFDGQTLEQAEGELVFIRLTDDKGNTIITALNINEGRVIPLVPDETIITGDPWWRILLRRQNVMLWIGPFLAFLVALFGLMFLVAWRRRTFTVVFLDNGKVISKQSVKYKQAAEAPDSGPWDIDFRRVTKDLTINRVTKTTTTQQEVKSQQEIQSSRTTKSKTFVVPKIKTDKPESIKQPKSEESDTILEPLIQEPVKPAKPVVAAKAKPAVEEKPIKPPRKRRKPKQEVYAQVVALEQEGIMDDDLLGLEVLSTSKKPIKEVLPEEPSTEPTPTAVDEKQIDIFSQIGEEQPKPKRKKKDS